MVGKGLPMWLPKGAALRIRLQDFLRRIQARYDYQEVMCPPIGHKNLYITSGHYAKYGKDSFQPIHTPAEGEEYFLKIIIGIDVWKKACVCFVIAFPVYSVQIFYIEFIFYLLPYMLSLIHI